MDNKNNPNILILLDNGSTKDYYLPAGDYIIQYFDENETLEFKLTFSENTVAYITTVPYGVAVSTSEGSYDTAKVEGYTFKKNYETYDGVVLNIYRTHGDNSEKEYVSGVSYDKN